MKALTVRQPHASLIALGFKHIETRTKPTKYRGPLLVHAGLRPPGDRWVGEYFSWFDDDDRVWRWTKPFGDDFDAEADETGLLPLGAIVASCKLVDVVPIIYPPPLRPGDFTPETTVICKGITGTLWMVDPNGNAVPTHDQLPYGDFSPGRFAWLLEDIKPVEQRCPTCWVNPDLQGVCLTCDGHGRLNPIPTKGKLGLWEWTP